MKKPAITFRIDSELAKYIRDLTKLMNAQSERDSWNLFRPISQSVVASELLRLGIETHRKKGGRF